MTYDLHLYGYTELDTLLCRLASTYGEYSANQI